MLDNTVYLSRFNLLLKKINTENTIRYPSHNKVKSNMLFFVDIYVDTKDLTIDELWDLWTKEAQAAGAVPEGLIVGMWKVVAQRRIIGIMNAESHAQLDRMIMAGLPMSHYLEIKEITPVRDYADFAKDVINRWK